MEISCEGFVRRRRHRMSRFHHGVFAVLGLSGSSCLCTTVTTSMLPRRDIAGLEAGSLQSDGTLAIAMRMTDGRVDLFKADLDSPFNAVHTASAELVGSVSLPLPPSTVPVVVVHGLGAVGDPTSSDGPKPGLRMETVNGRCIDVVDLASPENATSVLLDYRRRVIWVHPRTIPVLLLLPAAIVVDVVTLPLQLIFFPQVERIEHQVDPDMGA